MPGFVRVCSANEVQPGTVKAVKVENWGIAIFNLGGCFYAARDVCPHEGAPLSAGLFEGENIVCPWHGATFHILTGKTWNPLPERKWVRL